MIGVQKKRFTSRNVFMLASGLNHYRGKISKFAFPLTATCFSRSQGGRAHLFARQICRPYSPSVHVFRSMLWVTVAKTSLMLTFKY
jgi:hypothetical protein